MTGDDWFGIMGTVLIPLNQIGIDTIQYIIYRVKHIHNMTHDIFIYIYIYIDRHGTILKHIHTIECQQPMALYKYREKDNIKIVHRPTIYTVAFILFIRISFDIPY